MEAIKEQGVSPRPRWRFLAKEWLVWASGILSLLVGAAAVSVIRYLSENSASMESGKSFGAWLLLSLPYFWMVLLALFLWVFYYNLKHTKRGYRYPMYQVAGAAFLLSILLGLAFYSVGIGQAIDVVLGRAPLYDRIINPHVSFWSRPEDGRLSGLIIFKEPSGDSLILVDRRRSRWSVHYLPEDEYLAIPGQPVRALGEISGPGVFKAERLMRFQPAGREFFDRLYP
ncbi:MAG: hypothetical protein ACM3PZ_02395 [Bacillota bacterium]